ncbi:MAG: PorP/SprF family type IX secretion system membrane protein [Prevotella sp.]|nr:PorP/SprF family type IX secretion system membrane protein [Candidatus Prevotella equi]
MLALTSIQVSAQYDPYFSHYYDMQTSFNPAAAGKEDRLNVYAVYAMSLAGFENAPQVVSFAGDMPFRTKKVIHGVGAKFMNDKIGLFNHQHITAQYAMRLRALKGNLSIGINAGMITEKFKGSEVELGEEGDPVFPKSDVDGNSVDLGVGIYYSRKNWYVGISAQHLNYPTVKLGEMYEFKIDGTYYAMGGVDFQLRNPALKILTSAIVRTDLTSYRADITGRLQYSFDGKMLYAGIGVSPTNSVTVLIGGKFQGFLVGYSFEAFTNGISIRNGSHEMHIGYQMDVDLGKKGKNRHQTTRTL